MFKGPGKIVRENKSSSYPVFELTGVNCKSSICSSRVWLVGHGFFLFNTDGNHKATKWKFLDKAFFSF